MAKRTLKLSQIRLDGNTQPRVELDEALVSEYKEAYLAGVQMPPLDVMFDGTDYWLWDGFHRRFGADHAGLEKLPCNVTNGTREDAQWASYGANKSHGLRRLNCDKQKAVKAALRHPKGPKCSNVELAEHCGVGESMVRKYRDEMESTSQITKSDTRTGRDGRTINTANIGKPKPPEHHPVADDDADDDQDAGGDTPRVSSVELPEESAAPSVDLPEPTSQVAADFREWLTRVVRQRWDNDNGDLTLAIVSNELYVLSEEVVNWN